VSGQKKGVRNQIDLVPDTFSTAPFPPQITNREVSKMNASQKCASCGGDNLQPGALTDFSVTQFAPKKKRSRWLCCRVPVIAMACLDCGAVTLSANPEKLRRAVGQEHLASIA
jgi:hypothetical protein